MKRNGGQPNNFFNVKKRLVFEPVSNESEGTSDVASNQSIHSGTSSGRGTPEYRGIRTVGKIDPTYHQSMVQELSEMADNLVRRFEQQSWDPVSRFFSDVFVYRSDGERLGLERLLSNAGSNYRRHLFWFVTDVNEHHIHCIHDCKFSNRSCRCAWRAEIIAKFPGSIKQAIGKRRFINQFTTDDWIDVFIYYCLRKWGKPQKIWIDGKSQGLPSASESLRWEEMQRKSSEILAGVNGRVPDNLFEEGQGNSENGPNVTRSGWINVRPKTTLFDTIIETVQALLEKFPTWPIRAIKKHEEFRQNRVLINPQNAKAVEEAFTDFGLRLCNYTLRDFYDFYHKEGCEPIFSPSCVYYTLEESVEVVNDLLKFQFNDDEAAIASFLNDLVTVFERKIEKFNTICFLSPPNSGKNFFLDMLIALSLNTGQYTIANKLNNFAFQEGPDKRLIFWDEPNYCSSYTELLKLLLGGMAANVNVKNKMQGDVQRTPHFIMSNNPVDFMHDIAFKTRIKVFRWKECSWLKDYDKKPYPLALFSLLIKYNIEFYKMLFVGYKPANVQASSDSGNIPVGKVR